jgi:hypothetical protein
MLVNCLQAVAGAINYHEPVDPCSSARQTRAQFERVDNALTERERSDVFASTACLIKSARRLNISEGTVKPFALNLSKGLRQ